MLGASKTTANAAIVAAGFAVGTVSTTNTDNPALVDTLVTPLSSDGVDILNAPIDYTIYSPFFPPFFPPSFCSCIAGCNAGNITSVGVRQYGQYSHLDPAGYGWSCDSTMSYEYWTCGCGIGACQAEGGYNGAYRDGVCGYSAPPDPCAGYVCSGSPDCYKYTFTDVSVNSLGCGDNGDGTGTACYWAWGDCNCDCPATTVYQLYCGAC